MTAKRYRIVVGLDLSDFAEIVLEHAIDQAARHDAPDLHFIAVVANDADLDDAKARLAQLVLPALDDLDCADWQVRLHISTGKPAEEITNLAAELRAHLIVVGRFGANRPHRRIGKVASEVIDLATCPTYVVTLTDQSPDAETQCSDCVTVRVESEGEAWFCAAHRAPDRERLSTMVIPGASSISGLMW